MSNLEITPSASGSGISIHNKPGKVFLLEPDQRELIKWLARNRSEMVRDIVCEECPEHMEAGKD
jgi:hypothetical protein